jgi:hypothetical protein
VSENKKAWILKGHQPLSCVVTKVHHGWCRVVPDDSEDTLGMRPTVIFNSRDDAIQEAKYALTRQAENYDRRARKCREIAEDLK